MKVLITGASSGIGRDIARVLALVNQYDEMVLVGRNEERLKSIKKELAEKSSATITTVSLELSIQENCIKLYNENKDVDLLVNNAGFGDFGEFNITDLSKETMMINTNIIACHTLTKLYLQDMKKKNSGHILNVASIAGCLPGPLMATYYATKGYVIRLSEAIREELRREKSKVKISVLCPGPVATNFNKTANISFNFKGMDSLNVAKYTIKHLNRFYIVPGIPIKMLRIASKIIPSRIMAKMVYMTQRKRKK